MYGRHLLAKSVYHERSPYIIEIALEFAVIGKIKLHDFIHIRSVFVLFPCSLSLDFMKAGWFNRWIVLVAGEFPSVHGIQCLFCLHLHLWRQGWLAEKNRRKNPCFSLKKHIILELFFDVLWGVPMIQCDQLSQVCIGHPPFF